MKVNLRVLLDVFGLLWMMVSCVLNGYDDVSEVMCECVMKVVWEMGYVVDLIVCWFVIGWVDMIGIVYLFGVGDFGDLWFGEVVVGIIEWFVECNFDFIIVFVWLNVELDMYWWIVDGKFVDGLIVVCMWVDDLCIVYL